MRMRRRRRMAAERWRLQPRDGAAGDRVDRQQRNGGGCNRGTEQRTTDKTDNDEEDKTDNDEAKLKTAQGGGQR